MTRGLDEIGVNVCFVLPTAVPVSGAGRVQLRSPTDLTARYGAPEEEISQIFEHGELHRLPAVLQAYATPVSFEREIRWLIKQTPPGDGSDDPLTTEVSAETPTSPSGALVKGGGAHYVGNLMGQIHRYARLAVEIARRESFDVVHAHDWMTYPAGLAVAAATRKPLVIHVHSTEFDRSGENVNQQIYDIERAGMHGASRVICVSHLTQKIVTSRYAVPSERVDVVYNAVDLPEENEIEMKPIRRNEKIVLFLGRITMQKGPEYFLRAAKKVVEKYPDVRFVVAGSGDMISQCIRQVAELKLGKHVTFTGFLRGHDVDRIFQIADLYVMPSVSEPFGIAPLEALSHNVPVIISKQSGVSEVLTHALKVDFWDIDEIANKILAVLKHPPLQKTLRDHGHFELRKFSWRDSAERLNRIYTRVIGEAQV